jgi:predicted nucleic acid-binding protein
VILVDTSVWIDHLRQRETRLRGLLEEAEVLVHPLVEGELACGNLAARQKVLALIRDLPRSLVAEHADVMALLEARRLFARGLGYVDLSLLASTMITPDARLLTHDRRLAMVAAELGIAAA